MKKIITVAIIALIALSLNINFAIAQSTNATNLRTGSFFLGWLNTGGSTGTLEIRNDWNDVINLSTNTHHHATLDVNGNYTIGLTNNTNYFGINNDAVLWHNGSVNNIFVGVGAGSSSLAGASGATGTDNVAVGYNALSSNSTTIGNVAVGSGALQDLYLNFCGADCITNYSGNNAVGFQALNHTQAYGGCAMGYWAGYENLYGCSIVAIGEQALYNNLGTFDATTGNDNVAVGGQTLYTNQYGNGNTGIGDNAGAYAQNSGEYAGASYNSFFGQFSGVNFTTGDYCTFLGWQSGVPASSTVNNSTTIGANAIVTHSNQMILGDNNVVNVGIGYSGDPNLPPGRFSVRDSVGSVTSSMAGYFNNRDNASGTATGVSVNVNGTSTNEIGINDTISGTVSGTGYGQIGNHHPTGRPCTCWV